MENSFGALYKKTQVDDGSTELSFEQSRFFPQAVATAGVFATMLVFLPVSCTTGFAMIPKHSNDVPVVQIGLMMAVLLGLFWFFLVKTQAATVTVKHNVGIAFDGNTLPFADIKILGLTTKSNSKKTWAYVFAESGGREIAITKWMDEAQARAIKNEIKGMAGGRFD